MILILRMFGRINNDSGRIDPKMIFTFSVLTVFTLLSIGFIIKVPIEIALIIIVIFLVAFISFISTEIALYILIASMLLGPEFVTGQIGAKATSGRGVTLRLDDFLLVIIGFGWFAKTAVFKELGIFLKTPLNKPILYYILAAVFATILGMMFGRVQIKTGFFFVLKYIEYFIVFFMVANNVRDKKQITHWIIALLLTCAIVSLVGISQIPEGGRVSAPFEGETGEPNTLGGYLVLMGSIVLGLLLTYGTNTQKAFLGVLLILISITLSATLSRSSWLSVAPMLAALIFFNKKKMVIIIPLLLMISLSPFILPKSVKDRVLYTVTQPKHKDQVAVGNIRIDTSTSARLNTWKEVLVRDFVQHPLFGYGVAGYGFLDAQYPRVLIESGLVGLTAFIFLLAAIYKNALFAYHNVRDPFLKGISLGYLAGFISLVVHGIGANTFIIVRIMEPFWFLTGIIIMIPSLEAKDERIEKFEKN